ncbi:hypothetical protein [Streptomyces sp. NPDC048710]|uniref:hypothetical protein n=1 Tax=Streptomyces sp. NPDC048710 TaxID=3365586 RepID=UPI003715881A
MADRLGDLRVLAQEHFQQVPAADDALRHAHLVDDGKPLDFGVRHDVGGVSVASARTVTAGEVIRSCAVSPPAFAGSPGRRSWVARRPTEATVGDMTSLTM